MRRRASISKTTAVSKTVSNKSKPASEALAHAMQHEQFIDQLAIAKGNDGKNPAAQALSRLGAGKGGHARAASLSPKRRSLIAKRAARARWGKKSDRS